MRAEVAVEIEPGAASELQVGADVALQLAEHGWHAVAVIERTELLRAVVIDLHRSASEPFKTVGVATQRGFGECGAMVIIFQRGAEAVIVILRDPGGPDPELAEAFDHR